MRHYLINSSLYHHYLEDEKKATIIPLRESPQYVYDDTPWEKKMYDKQDNADKTHLEALVCDKPFKKR